VEEHAHVCPLCGKRFCYEHKEPEAHNCVKLGTRDWDVYLHERGLRKKKNPRVTLGDRSPIDYEQIRAAHEIRHTKSRQDSHNIEPREDLDEIKPQKHHWGSVIFIILGLIVLTLIYILLRDVLS
jgi:hypothetical protein